MDRDRLIEEIADALAEVDANHDVYHQRPYMEWASAALAVVEKHQDSEAAAHAALPAA